MPKPTDLDNPTESAVEASGDGEPAAGDSSTLAHRVAGSSIAEIDRLTSELHTLREQLLSQGARVQREIAKYARLNRSVVQSTKLFPGT